MKFVKIFLLKKLMHYAVYVMPSIYIATFFKYMYGKNNLQLLLRFLFL